MLFGFAGVIALALGGLQLAGAFAVASERHAALHYADIALEQARTALVAQIGTQVAAGVRDGPYTVPTPSPFVPVCPVSSSALPSPCPFSASVSVTLDGQTGVPGMPNELAVNMEHAEQIFENRVAATLVATVVSPAVRVVRRRSVTLRTYGVAPFASDDGSDEPTIDDVAGGDSGGICDGSAVCDGTDTRIHTKLICLDPADPSKCDGYADVLLDNFQNANWYNAHAVQRAWSE